MAKSLRDRFLSLFQKWQKARFQGKLEKILTELTEKNGIAMTSSGRSDDSISGSKLQPLKGEQKQQK